MDMNVLYPIKERSIRLIQRICLFILLPLLLLFTSAEAVIAPLWSDYYLNHLEISKNYHDYYELIDSLVGFIKNHYPGIPEEDLKLTIASIMEASEKHKVDPRLIASLIAAESGFRKTAVSHKGARGLTQLMPDKCQDFDWRDIRGNVDRGTRYLRMMLDRFDSVSLALAAYNAGPTRIARNIRENTSWPRETRYYVSRVQVYYRELSK
ncbi:MAG TPA: lytic transglycosylase domain-containing protein [Firmicutes bacterium]|nr:lytic transglycosylase domain-containing protein [Bacillota bacterium]